MSATRKKKIEKRRGHRTCGYGGSKKHRGKGSRGGKGKAGSLGHKATYYLKYARDELGKRGFRSKTGRKLRTVNLRTLQKLAGKEKKIDVQALGYDKVLGAGEMKAALEVKAELFSAGAKEKIERAGGKAIGPVAKNVAEAAPKKQPKEKPKENEIPLVGDEDEDDGAEDEGEEA